MKGTPLNAKKIGLVLLRAPLVAAFFVRDLGRCLGRSPGLVAGTLRVLYASSIGAPTFAATLALGLAAVPAQAELAPLAGAADQPPAPWAYAGLPDQKPPATRYDVVTLDGRRVLRVRAEGSYGNLVHPLAPPADAAAAADASGSAAGATDAAPTLAWRWRVDEPLGRADLRSKAGDDAALKVCALFDLPLDAMPFWERQKMRLARSVSGQHLPGATLCYVWEPSLPPGTVLPNAHSPRLRWWVLGGPAALPGRWQAERRDLRADFLRAFGDETRTLPPLLAIGVGADADNTGGRSLGYVDALTLTR